jgi:hypothetical protein
MVIVNCIHPGCEWKTPDRTEAFALLLNTELASHMSESHPIVTAGPQMPTPAQKRPKVNPPTIDLGASREEFSFFEKHWDTFKTTGISGAELRGQLLYMTSQKL